MNCSWRRLSLGLAVVAVSAAGSGATLMGSTSAGATTRISSSQSVAGYKVSASSITSFSGTVTVPTLSCPSTGTYSSDLSVQLVGGISGGSFIRLTCKTGVAGYSAFLGFATFPNGAKTFTVAPGNTVQTQLTMKTAKGDSVGLVVVTNETTGVVTQKYVKADGKLAADTAGWEVFQHVGGAPVPPFGSVNWSGASANGETFAAADAQRYQMVDTKKVVLVTTSVLGATGSTFTNRFKAST